MCNLEDFQKRKKKVKSKTHNVVTCSDTFVIDFRLGVEEWVCSMSFEWDNKSVSEKEGGGGGGNHKWGENVSRDRQCSFLKENREQNVESRGKEMK